MYTSIELLAHGLVFVCGVWQESVNWGDAARIVCLWQCGVGGHAPDVQAGLPKADKLSIEWKILEGKLDYIQVCSKAILNSVLRSAP